MDKLEKSKSRIWELDFIRGFCILLMILDHTLYDLAYIFGYKWALAFFGWPLRTFIRWIAILCFVGISGISSTLSRSNLVRGVQLAGVALVLTLATALMDKFSGQANVLIIRFGILHMLAACMIIYALIKDRSLAFRGTISAVTILIGIYFMNFPLKISAINGGSFLINVLPALVNARGGFYSSDYFHILPWLGFFIIGGIIGQLFYSKKQSLIPLKKPGQLVNGIRFVGRYSLHFYVLHQPVIYGLLTLVRTLMDKI